jgi:hypothetical protein
MTGQPDWNRYEFALAEQRLSVNHTVLNPANHIPIYQPESITHDQYMSIALAMLDCCDAVYMLHGWQDSKGARIEHQYAIEHGKVIMYQEEER